MRICSLPEVGRFASLGFYKFCRDRFGSFAFVLVVQQHSHQKSAISSASTHKLSTFAVSFVLRDFRGLCGYFWRLLRSALYAPVPAQRLGSGFCCCWRSSINLVNNAAQFATISAFDSLCELLRHYGGFFVRYNRVQFSVVHFCQLFQPITRGVLLLKKAFSLRVALWFSKLPVFWWLLISCHNPSISAQQLPEFREFCLSNLRRRFWGSTRVAGRLPTLGACPPLFLALKNAELAGLFFFHLRG